MWSPFRQKMPIISGTYGPIIEVLHLRGESELISDIFNQPTDIHTLTLLY